MTGFDRMLIDKLKYFRFNGNWFAFFGVANVLAYGAHLVMNEQWYRYHFAYTSAPPRLFTPIKSMIGSDTLSNVIWTAPSLIGLNFYMQKKLGSLVMTKFFFLSLFTSFMFLSIFNPQTGLNFRPL